MALVLDVVLVADRYDAGGGLNPRQVEWPPHPARVVAALRSVAQGSAEPDALRHLERLAPPTIHASELVGEGQIRGYVVTNTLRPKGGNLSHPGRTSQSKERRHVFPRDPRVQFVWHDDADVSDDVLAKLDELARRVPYLGRATSVVLMGARRVADPAPPEALRVFEPSDSLDAEQRVRVPYPGYIDELEALFESGGAAWQATDNAQALRGYRWAYGDARLGESGPGGLAPRVEPHPSPYRDLLVLRLVNNRIDGSLTPRLTAALRSAVMSRTGEPLPAALHGHGLDGQPHVAYLGLPVVGHEHADGHLVALAVAIPGLDPDERRRVLRGVLGADGQAGLNLKVPGFTNPLELLYDPAAQKPLAANPSRWLRPSRQWVSVTPVVLDRYPKRGDLKAALLKGLRLSGLPEPQSLVVSTEALTPGAIRLSPRDLPKRAQGRLFCHARVQFAEPVAGPVLVGAGRYFGVGLFAPETVTREVAS